MSTLELIAILIVAFAAYFWIAMRLLDKWENEQ